MPNLTPYNGFEIDDTHRIFKDGKQVFTAYWQRCNNLEDAKKLIDASNKLKAMPDMQRLLTKLTGCCELENGSRAAREFSEWMEREGELNM